MYVVVVQSLLSTIQRYSPVTSPSKKHTVVLVVVETKSKQTPKSSFIHPPPLALSKTMSSNNSHNSSSDDSVEVNLPANEEDSPNIVPQHPHAFQVDDRNVAVDNPALVAAMPPAAMQVPYFPSIADAILMNDPNINLAGLDAIHSSILRELQYQHMLNNMGLIAQLSSALDYSAVDSGVQVAAAAANNFSHLQNFGYPLIQQQPLPASDFSAVQYPTFDPVQNPHPQVQEVDYDNREEERKPYGQRCLLYLVEERYWVEALQRVTSHPHEASTFGIQGRAPLHLACDHDAPAFLVHALLCVWPQGAFMVGTSYMNPLHITCSSQHASNEIVNLLLSGSGDPLRITGAKDVDGDTPLHAACRCAAPIDVLATLLQTNKDIVMWHDYEGLNPILRLWVRYYVMLGDDVIAGIKSANDLTPELVEAWQKSLLLLRVMNEVHKRRGRVPGDRQGSIPFYAVHSASAVECPRCVLRIATCLYPDQLLITDENDMLPLHIATKAPIYVSIREA